MLNILTNSIGNASSDSKVIKRKKLCDMLIDSATIAAITLFSVWTGVPSWEQAFIVLKATGLAFAIQFAYERGIKRSK